MPLPHDPYSPQDPDTFESKPVQPSAQTEESVPKGTTSELLAWVGDDKDRAQRALDAETSTDKPRKGLVDELKEITSK